MSKGQIPLHWANVLTRLAEASVAGAVMRSHDATGTDRDIATDLYVTAVDALVADLQALKSAGLLGRISIFLASETARPKRRED